MGSECSSAACCNSDAKTEEKIEKTITVSQRVKETINFESLKQIRVPDEMELLRIENVIGDKLSPEQLSNEICARTSVGHVLSILRKAERTRDEYD